MPYLSYEKKEQKQKEAGFGRLKTESFAFPLSRWKSHNWAIRSGKIGHGNGEDSNFLLQSSLLYLYLNPVFSQEIWSLAKSMIINLQKDFGVKRGKKAKS